MVLYEISADKISKNRNSEVKIDFENALRRLQG